MPHSSREQLEAELRLRGDRRVGALARSNTSAADFLFDFVKLDRQTWTLSEWRDELKKLDRITDTVEDWLANRWLY